MRVLDADVAVRPVGLVDVCLVHPLEHVLPLGQLPKDCILAVEKVEVAPESNVELRRVCVWAGVDHADAPDVFVLDIVVYLVLKILALLLALDLRVDRGTTLTCPSRIPALGDEVLLH